MNPEAPVMTTRGGAVDPVGSFELIMARNLPVEIGWHRPDPRVKIRGMDLTYPPEAEQFRTEISCKFTRETLEREYRAVGLRPLAWYTDPDGLFALSLTGPET